MATWYVDEGLATLIREWKKAHPGAVVYTIADESHSQNPNVSQHAPDDGGKAPGDDKGEVDAGDFMPGKGAVTDADLDDLAEGLRTSRDKRLLIVIRRNRIFSSYAHEGIPPFTWRPYKGKYHGHTHVSMNDLFDANVADWDWEKEVVRSAVPYVQMDGKAPLLMKSDEDDALAGFDHIIRMQALINVLDSSLPALDIDGVYGSKTAQKLARVMASRESKTTTNGTRCEEPEWRTLWGFSN